MRQRYIANLMIVMLSLPWFAPKPQLMAPIDPYQTMEFRKAFFDAARIYGKAGCGDMSLAEMTAKNSLRAGVPANVLASVVAVESSCNPLAISIKGAVGLTQINVKVYADKYDNFKTVNLFDPEQAMKVGADILRDDIQQYGGLKGGVSHYNGSGPDADAYAVKVLGLAGK
jgi:soluble lytic murein transglycosylase-like protein